MIPPTVVDPQSAWAARIFHALAEAGVRDVLVSPGSRSTPFVLAASRTPALRLWDIVDERSAAFFALGQARLTGRPSLALCTSGSAAAHYLPAIIEAGAAHVPLLLMTADRPLELQGCAAPQTIDQVKLYGDHVRAFVELGLPDADATAIRAIGRTLAQAVFQTQWPTPGPVHINVRARKPLEPHAVDDEIERLTLEELRTAGSPMPRAYAPRASPSEAGLEALVTALRQSEAPLFCAGPGPLSQGAAARAVAELVRRAGGVLLADAASQLRFADVPGLHAYDLYAHLPEVRARTAPDLIVQLGSAPTTTTLAAAQRWVIAPAGWQDPESTATHLLFGDVAETAAALGARLPEAHRPTSRWQQRWHDLDGRAQTLLSAHAESGPELTEGAAIREAVRALPSGGVLAIGNSLAIRELDLFCPGSLGRIGVLSQRGANGIDGLLSGAAGAASSGTPVTLVFGDVSFLHDVGGLWAARLVENLTIVVLQNRGGRIFEDLPLAAAGVAEQLHHFTTPHAADLAAAAAIFGLPHQRVETRAALRSALASPFPARSPTRILEALVPARGLAAVRSRLADHLRRELTA